MLLNPDAGAGKLLKDQKDKMLQPILQPNGKFDFVEAAAQAYKFVWDKKAILAQLALVPFLIKAVSFIIIVILGLESNYLRSGLILLPSYAAEGWLAAQAIRLAIMLQPQRFAQVPLQNALFDGPGGYRSTLLAATILYALIKLTTAFMAGLVGTLENVQPADTVPYQISPVAGFIVAFGALVFMVWAFRYVWLYVPVAMGYGLGEFLRRIRSFMLSFYMISLWLICFIPMVLMLLIVSEVMLTLFPMISDTEHSAAFTYAMVFVQSGIEILVSIIASVAMAFAVQSIMSPGKPKA